MKLREPQKQMSSAWGSLPLIDKHKELLLGSAMSIKSSSIFGAGSGVQGCGFWWWGVSGAKGRDRKGRKKMCDEVSAQVSCVLVSWIAASTWGVRTIRTKRIVMTSIKDYHRMEAILELGTEWACKLVGGTMENNSNEWRLQAFCHVAKLYHSMNLFPKILILQSPSVKGKNKGINLCRSSVKTTWNMVTLTWAKPINLKVLNLTCVVTNVK